jgi:hypothetical protein
MPVQQLAPDTANHGTSSPLLVQQLQKQAVFLNFHPRLPKHPFKMPPAIVVHFAPYTPQLKPTLAFPPSINDQPPTILNQPPATDN